MSEYITRQGDTVDYICWKTYGTTRGGVVEAVLEANTGLADQGVYLPAGLMIDLPDLAAPVQTVELIRLWD